MSPTLAVTIITKNEENNIRAAIESVLFANEIIVVDSFSTDLTKQIVDSFGDKVKFYQNDFVGHGAQKNFAALQSNQDWIFNLDADERVDETLQHSIMRAIENPNGINIWQCKRKNFFCGKWIQYGGWYPDFNARLYKKEEAAFSTPKVHEILQAKNNKISQKMGTLQGNLLHYSFPHFASQIDTNVRYAYLGHFAIIEKNYSHHKLILLMLVKPIGKFIECYFLKRGLLDGINGFVIAINASYSLFMKYSHAYYNKVTPKR